MKKRQNRLINFLLKNVSKEDFLTQLREEWVPVIGRNTDPEMEAKAAYDRIVKSGKKSMFDKVGITQEDLVQVIKDIQEDKPAPFHREGEKTGRNDLCPCGSGIKYKRCCGL